ncbi:MAG TPA: sigma-70 family RNA polymerase sigma factor [Candidatus Acidoferrum sp.]|nr:sigma-70 family RNA polymerase sigma factor [Candidatus Acidoferrum sp.]
MSLPPLEITQLLQAWFEGQAEALDRLMPLVYEELHRAASLRMAGEKTGATLQTTALVNEVYLRLVNFPAVNWQNRAHFFAACSKLMRRILVDFARNRNSQKRGGGESELTFEDGLFVAGEQSPDVLALDEALNNLAAMDARKSQVVEMRFFGGLSVAEIAGVLQVSEETVQRDWRLAKAWLFRALNFEKSDGY